MIRMGVDNLWFHNTFFSSLGKKPLFKKKSRQPWQMWNIPCAMTITREFDCLNRICLEALQIQKIGPYRYLDSITVTWSWVLNLPYVSVQWCYMLLSLWCATSMFRAHFLPFCVSSKSSIVDFDHVCRSASFFRRRALSKHTKQPYTENGSPFRLCFPHCMFVHFVVLKHTFLEFPWHKITPFHKCEKNTVIVRNILILDARNEIQHLAKKNAHKMENIDAADQRWHCTSLRYTSFMRKQQCLQCMRMDPPSNYPGEVADSRFVATNWWCTARVLQNAVPARHLYYKMTRNNSTKTPWKRMFKNMLKNCWFIVWKHVITRFDPPRSHKTFVHFSVSF